METDPEVKSVRYSRAAKAWPATGVTPRESSSRRMTSKFAPLCVDRDKVMVQYSLVEAERAGLLKMDFWAQT